MLETGCDIIRLKWWGFYLRLIKILNELLGKEKSPISVIKSLLVNCNINKPKCLFTYRSLCLIPSHFSICLYKILFMIMKFSRAGQTILISSGEIWLCS
jgi:hypothetical protein